MRVFQDTLAFTLSLVIAQCITTVSALISRPIRPASIPLPTDFNWMDIEPSEELAYHKCYEVFECARLLAPLDWQNTSNPQRVAIAVIRLPATVPENDPSHGGSLILNPGGPGGSGVQMCLHVGHTLQRHLDGEKHYEILSFDPRGVYQSTPSGRCFRSDVDEDVWLLEKSAVGNLGDSPYALQFRWVTDAARVALCEQDVLHDGDNLRNYLTTASVATDMLRIVDKIEELKRSVHQASTEGTSGNAGTQIPLSSLETNKEKSKIQYLGGSYGTFLGITFANLYPERVGRMLLDSNIDADDWVSVFKHVLTDIGIGRQYFFTRCLEAQSRCPLWRPEDKSSESIEKRLYLAFDKLQEAPIASTHTGRMNIIDYADAETGLFTMLYNPLISALPYATAMNSVLNGTRPIVPSWVEIRPECRSECSNVILPRRVSTDIPSAIICGDGPDMRNATLETFKEFLNDSIAQSQFAGGLMAEVRLPCWRWPFRPKFRYSGPFNASVPILFLNNRIDPVCPIGNAHKMAAQHKGSVVLESLGVGHGVLFEGGDCVWDHVKKYIDTGVLPPVGTVCKPACEAFDEDCQSERVEGFAYL